MRRVRPPAKGGPGKAPRRNEEMAVTAEARAETPRRESTRQELESVVIRFAGDSGDGVQLTGSQFAQVTALAGNDLATFPDFPAELRAHVGPPYGVSAFQINSAARKPN